MAPALDQLIATHDATHREFARAIARGDTQGANAANRDLTNIGEQLDQAAQASVANATQEIDSMQTLQPELRAKMRALGAEAAELGRLSHRRVDNSTRSAELEQSAAASRAAISTSQAAFIIFVAIALALITGYHRVVIASGVFLLMAFYKPFSTSVRWQRLLSML